MDGGGEASLVMVSLLVLLRSFVSADEDNIKNLIKLKILKLVGQLFIDYK